jgi:hypothetical protein
VHWQTVAGTTYLLDCQLDAKVTDGTNAVVVDLQSPMPIANGHLLLVRKPTQNYASQKYFVRLTPVAPHPLILRRCDITAVKM